MIFLTPDQFWQEFLATKGLDPATKYFESTYFGIDKKMANDLLALVLSGQKRATASSLLAYECENSPLPQVGDYSIITDFDDTPHCVIQTTAVTILPFNKMTYNICKREGEDDTLESWQTSHRHCFTIEGKELGYEFTEDMSVVFEDFKVVYTKTII
ncbi:MAG: ASCH domain-containing protein [Defluviitaleaceae bacterium]|nr:ASCH domain-containing protein [Defluviitaleaceae bacterium]